MTVMAAPPPPSRQRASRTHFSKKQQKRGWDLAQLPKRCHCCDCYGCAAAVPPAREPHTFF
ncbi:MAG: hypothetical protein FWE78_02395 [Methanimicrococcus sp.]|nr:hypothetical protein [Methanimicrococcus sp.]